MKVIHILQSSHFSGAENVVCQIIKLFENNSDYEMLYVSRGGTVEPVLEQMGIPYYKLERFNVQSVRKAIKELKPDIVHAHDISASTIAALATIGTKCRVISHVHVNNSNMSCVNIKTVVYGISTLRFSRIFWVSQSCYDGYVFKKFVERKSNVLRNMMIKSAIIEKKDCDLNNYNYDVAYVGRLTEQKDPDRLIEVLRQLVKKIPAVKIAIVGTGNLEEHTRHLAEQNSLMNNINFLGFMNNPLKVLEGSKVMIMTSKYEGLPMTVLEAMALGVPIVSTPVDGLKDVIVNGVNGYLEDENELLVQRLFNIIDNIDLRNQLSDKAAEEFNKINDLSLYKAEIKRAYEE